MQRRRAHSRAGLIRQRHQLFRLGLKSRAILSMRWDLRRENEQSRSHEDTAMLT